MAIAVGGLGLTHFHFGHLRSLRGQANRSDDLTAQCSSFSETTQPIIGLVKAYAGHRGRFCYSPLSPSVHEQWLAGSMYGAQRQLPVPSVNLPMVDGQRVMNLQYSCSGKSHQLVCPGVGRVGLHW